MLFVMQAAVSFPSVGLPWWLHGLGQTWMEVASMCRRLCLRFPMQTPLNSLNCSSNLSAGLTNKSNSWRELMFLTLSFPRSCSLLVEGRWTWLSCRPRRWTSVRTTVISHGEVSGSRSAAENERSWRERVTYLFLFVSSLTAKYKEGEFSSE